MKNIVCSVLLWLIIYPTYGQIIADFTTNKTEACNSLQTVFYDQSTSNASIISWAWDLSGNTSSEQNPGAIFSEPGKYTICLTVTDVNGLSNKKCKEDYITIYPNPVADFTIDNTEGCVPVSVTFTDGSSSENGSIVSWLWDVGGSAGVVEQTMATDFVSKYSIQGSYTASLTVVDEQGCTTTKSSPNSVIANSITTPEIDINLQPACSLPWLIDFNITNADPQTIYSWDFGNGQTYTGEHPPSIMYDNVGEYDISIFMEAGECKDTLVLKKAVNTNSSASFTYGPSNLCVGTEISFTDNSILVADALEWQFGDGTTSTETNPSHSYNTPGCYDVLLIRTSGTCIDTATAPCITVLPEPNITYDITNQYNCATPTEVVLHADANVPGDFTWIFHEKNDSITYNGNDIAIDITSYDDYMVDLKFTGDNTCSTSENSIPIVISPLEAMLPVEGPSGCFPLTFSLMDSVNTQSPIVFWEWIIEDGLLSSNAAKPTFTIQDTGRYDVQLVVENANGCVDTVFIEDYIKVGMLPEVNFVGSPLEGCIALDKYFTDLSSDYVDSWEWIFGATGTSTNQNPKYNFAQPGKFDVALYASHNGCTDSIRFTNYVTIFEPKSSFTVDYNCLDPYTVEITNRSKGADSLLWTLTMDETTSINFTDSIFGTYTFPDRGEYVLSHYSYNDSTECEHTYRDTIKIVDPIARYGTDTLRGCAPFELVLNDLSQDAFKFEYSSDIATIDTSTIFASATYTEGGVVIGPTLIITDIHECRDTFQLADSVIVNKLKAIVDVNDVICIPDVGSMTEVSTDKLGTITERSWNLSPVGFSSTQATTSYDFDSIGLYKLAYFVEDDWGCKDSLIVPIQAVEIVPEFTVDSLSCTWAPVHFIATQDNGHVARYEWDFGDGKTGISKKPKHTYQNEGTYTVCLTMYDGRGCSKTLCKDNIVKISNPVPVFVGNPLSATCPPLLTNFDNQSSNADSYIWDFGDNSGISTNEEPSHVYTSPGKYDVSLIVQSTPQCRDTLTYKEYINVEGPIGSFVTDIHTQCIPINITLNATSDDLYTYVWDLGNGILDSIPQLVDTHTKEYGYTQPGRYTPKLIITDDAGCSRSFSGTSIIVEKVDIDFSIEEDTICGTPITIDLVNNSVGSTENIDFTWIVDGPETKTSKEKNPNINLNTRGQYDVLLIAAYANCIDTLNQKNFLEVAEFPNVQFDILSDELCENVNVEFNNNSSVPFGEITEWNWDFGDGNKSTDPNPTHQYQGLESKTITLKATTDRGCSGEYSASFDVLPSTLAKVPDDRNICIGDNVALNGQVENLQEGGGYYWEPDNSLSCTDCLSPIASPQDTTAYIFVAIHPNGCESRDTIVINMVPIIGPDLMYISDSIVCQGDSATINITNYNTNYQYYWDATVAGQDCYENCQEINVLPTQQTTYYLKVENEYGCERNDSIKIDVESTFEEFLIDSRVICEGSMTTLSTTSGDSTIWRPDPTINCTDCPSIDVFPTQNQYYYATVGSEIGCRYTDSVWVEIIPKGNTHAGEDVEICAEEIVYLQAEGSGNPMWTSNQTLIDTTKEATINPTESAFVLLTMSNDECIQKDSLFVTVYNKAEIEGVGDTICYGFETRISASGRVDRYEWQTMEKQTENKIDVAPDSTTIYRVIGNYRTCDADTAEILVYVHPEIKYQLAETFYRIHLNDDIKIDPTFDLNRQYQFLWTPSNGMNCSDCPDPMIAGITTSTDYQLLITDEQSGCIENVDIRVRFQNECTQNVFHLPNIFSPNNDGINDEFFVSTDNPEEFLGMQIYDRYGNLVFDEEEISETWDGKFNNVDVSTGVYVYKINLICPYNNKTYSILGDVTIIR